LQAAGESMAVLQAPLVDAQMVQSPMVRRLGAGAWAGNAELRRHPVWPAGSTTALRVELPDLA